MPAVVSVMQFVAQRREGPYVSYELALGCGTLLQKGIFTYDPYKVQWQLELQKFALPPGGSLVREFSCLDVSPDREFLFVGTTGGEMLVLMKHTNVFRSIIPVCTNCLASICVTAEGDVVCGGGDGTLHRLVG